VLNDEQRKKLIQEWIEDRMDELIYQWGSIPFRPKPIEISRLHKRASALTDKELLENSPMGRSMLQKK
jgi:hypothetical protein